MLDSVDGTYGGPTNEGKNGTGMVGMVMRGVRTCVCRLRQNNGFMFETSNIEFLNLHYIRITFNRIYSIC